MKIKTIEASGSNESMQPIGLKKWRGLRFVAEITEFEDERLCTIELQNKLESLLNPQLTDAETIKWEAPPLTNYFTASGPAPSIDRNAIDRLEKLIDDAETVQDLEFYADQAEKLGLVQHYMDKLKSLQ